MLQYGSPNSGHQCRKCKRVYPAEQVPLQFTRRRRRVRLHSNLNGDNRRAIGPLEYLDVCNRCLQIQRDEGKRRNRYLKKAHDAIRTHARNFKMRPDDFASAHQWVAEQLAHDFEHAEKNGCCYCHHLYAEMGHGLWDINVDIYDPRLPPIYGVNTRICCATCNRKKGDKTPEEWAQICKAFRAQEYFQPLLDAMAPVVQAPRQLSFFDGETTAA